MAVLETLSTGMLLYITNVSKQTRIKYNKKKIRHIYKSSSYIMHMKILW